MDAHSLYQMFLALVVIGIGEVIYFLPAVIANTAPHREVAKSVIQSVREVTNAHEA